MVNVAIPSETSTRFGEVARQMSPFVETTELSLIPQSRGLDSFGVIRRVPKQKKPPRTGAAFCKSVDRTLALTRFEPALRLVDDVYAAFATHNAAITVPVLERTERVANLHGASSSFSMARSSAGLRFGTMCRCQCRGARGPLA